MIQAVIFDMDGVLIDSIPSAGRVRTRLLAEYGIDFNELPDPHGEQHKGSSMKDLLTIVHAHHPDIAIDDEQFAKDLIEGVNDDLRSSGVAADPGLIKLLDELRERNIPCAVASAGLPASVDNKLGILGIKDYFQVIVTADDVAEHKPDPASYLLAMKKLGVEAANCIIFEDSLQGVQAGYAAGGKVIGFTKYAEPAMKLPGAVGAIRDWGEVDYQKLAGITNSDS